MNKSRDDLLHLLADLSECAPDLRFGQMIANLATLARGTKVEAIWDAEDEELIAAANRLVEHYRQRSASSV